MKIDGRSLALEVLKDIRTQVKALKKKKVVPQLAVILIGSDPASISFINQKAKAAKYAGAKLKLVHFKKTPLYQKLAEDIMGLAQDKTVHGIIIQRPVPPTLSAESLSKCIPKTKDVDGFLPKSEFLPPLGLAILKILNTIYYREILKKPVPLHTDTKPFLTWLKQKHVVLIGRGETGGKPIASVLQKYHINFVMLHSDSENPEEYIKAADIIVSTVGKSNIVKANEIKPGAIVLGVGLHREKGTLIGDYSEKEIEKVAGFYTPMPGGVGPMNVACLIQNLLTATK